MATIALDHLYVWIETVFRGEFTILTIGSTYRGQFELLLGKWFELAAFT